MKSLLIILPKHLLIESRQCRESEKQCEDAAHKGKNHENKSLMGPLESLGGGLKSLGALGKYPLFPSRQDHFGCDTTGSGCVVVLH